MQIKFLQSEVLSCKNLLAERLKDYEQQNEELNNVNNITANNKKEANEIYQKILKAEEYSEFVKQEIKTKQIEIDKYEKTLNKTTNDQEEMDSMILG